MKRTLLIATAIVFLPLHAMSNDGVAGAPRPNILFLLADDWAWPDASCLGTPGIQTPTFDRLAREGVLFRNAHVAAPSCSPSRAAILTGQWHWRLKEGANLRGFIPAEHAVYPDLLEKNGYFVGLAGKGYGPGTNQDRPHNAAGKEFKNFDAFLAARPKGAPFCFWLGSHFPHRPYAPGSGVKSGIDPAKVVVPPYLPDNEAVRSDICDYYLASEAFDRQAGEAVAALEKSGELDNTLIVMTGDNGWPFPRCKATCYESGTHQPLAVRWGTRVKGNRVVDDFVSLADLAPTFLEAAGVKPPAAMTARSFLNVLLSDKAGQVDPSRDHVLTGMERHAFNCRIEDGQSVGYPMRTILTKDFHYLRNFHFDRWPAGDPPTDPTLGFDAFAKNTFAGFADIDAGPSKAWLATHGDDPAFPRAAGKRPAEELYDLRKDPFELKNVAGDPAYARTVKELHDRLMAELKATGDPRAGGKGEELDRSPARPAARPNKPAVRPIAAPARPNVLFIAVDDLRPEMGCYGNAVAKTPGIDRLAARGVVFTRAYCQQAVCSPTRSSLMTGRRPDATRVWDLETHFRAALPDAVTLPQHFKANGYYCAALSKIYHHGFEDGRSWSEPHWYPSGQTIDTDPDDWSKRIVKKVGAGVQEYVNAPLPADNDKPNAGKPRKAPKGAAFEVSPKSDDELPDGRTAAEAVKRLHELKGKGQPFFLAVGFLKPHLPFVAPKKYWDLYDPDKIPLPAIDCLPEGAPSFAGHNNGELHSYANVPQGNPIPADFAKTLRHGYYACISYTDAQVGRLLDALEAGGLADNTVIVLWGDHGWQLGDHGLWHKHTNFEVATRAPLLISLPGQKTAGRKCGATVEFVDIYPTLADVCGLPVPSGLDGISLKPWLDNPAAPAAKVAISQYPRGGAQTGNRPLMGYSIRDARWRLTVWRDRRDGTVAATELYDEENDPAETVNLADRPEHKAVVERLSKHLPPAAPQASAKTAKPQENKGKKRAGKAGKA